MLNKKVGLASFLIGDNLKVNPVKKIVKDKKQYTALAKKVQEFEVCIDVLENKIAKQGVRNVYFVLTLICYSLFTNHILTFDININSGYNNL